MNFFIGFLCLEDIGKISHCNFFAKVIKVQYMEINCIFGMVIPGCNSDDNLIAYSGL